MATHRMRNTLGALGIVLALAAGAACSRSDSTTGGSLGSSTPATSATAASSTSASSSTSSGITTSSAPPRRLTILVTNDDGVDAPGIDVLVQVLRHLADVDLKVVAPAKNQSGTGGRTTPGDLPRAQATTRSGYPAVAVSGYPADTIRVAIDVLHIQPDVVVSGVNLGQNVGPLIDVSGTVGAARAAAARGIPAVAASQGIGTPVDYPVTAKIVLGWLRRHRGELHRDPGAKAGTIVNVNGPSCGVRGKVRGVATVPPAPAATKGALQVQDCTSTASPKNDVQALNVGFVVIDTIPLVPRSAG